MRPNLSFLSAASNANLKPGDLEEAVSERRKAFAAVHRSDEDRQASRTCFVCHLKPKTQSWQATCTSLSPKSNPRYMYPLLCSVAGSSSSSPYFLNCSSPRESASVFADYLRSYFSVSQPKALRSRARGYLSELCRPRALKSLTHSFAPPSPALNFLRLPLTFPRPLPLVEAKLPI